MNFTTTNLDINSTFTYEDANNYYKKLNITCSNDDNCPNHTYCYDDYYPFEHHSFNKDCSNDENCFSHCISHFYCKKDKSVCSFIKDDENEIRFSSKISASDNIFGLENREECKFDKECIAGHCGCGMNLIGHGSCREPSDSDGMCGLPIVMVLGPLFLIECILILFIILSLIEKFRLKRKGLIKVKRSSFKCSLKCLTIAAIVIGVIFISFFIYLGILAHIFKKINSFSRNFFIVCVAFGILTYCHYFFMNGVIRLW